MKAVEKTPEQPPVEKKELEVHSPAEHAIKKLAVSGCLQNMQRKTTCVARVLATRRQTGIKIVKAAFLTDVGQEPEKQECFVCGREKKPVQVVWRAAKQTAAACTA
ncbi:UNVERIFIED_CONTAM: hypothetical protein HHA_451130 [Hammondia hammondi]|eukprot:XP_008883745.1 hypothetical protein HHA_451130 [Hammondia hammondi]